MLAPGQSVTFSINDVSLTLDDGTPGPDPFVNTVTVNAADDEGTAATDTDTATINVTAVAPAITIVKSVDADGDTVFSDSETVPEGARTVDYQFTVTNTSNAADPLTVSAFADPTLNAAGVTDAALLAAFTAANGGSAVLAPGQSVTFTINDVSLTLDDGTPGPDPFVNTVTVNAADDEGTAATDTDTATINVTAVAPAITIVKSVDANGDTVFSDSETANEGTQTVSYQFTVTNTSNAADPLTVSAFADPTLNAAGVTDAALLAAFTAANGGSALLAPGQSVTFTINNVSLTLDDGTPGPDPFVNTVTVNAADDEGTAASDDDTATINVTAVAPAITIVKSVDANGDTVFSDSETANEGTQTVSYQFTVTNTSNAADPLTVSAFADPTLNAAGVTDAALLAAFTAANGGSALLAPGQSVTFTINNVSLTLDDGTPGPDPFVNTVTVNAADDEGTAASDDDTATINVTAVAPAIMVVKSADPTTVNEGGQSVTYTYAVTNEGLAVDPLTLTALVDDRGTTDTLDDVNVLASGTFVGGDTNGNTLIDAGETWTYTYTTSVTLNAGDSLTNVVTAQAHDDENTPTSDTDDATVTADDIPHPVLEQIFVDEDFLPAGHQDLPVPSPGDGPGGTSQTDTITLDFGADAAGATISFAALNGQQVFDTLSAAVQTSATNSNLFYFWDDASDTLYASTNITDLNTAIATTAFKLQITDAPTGAYTFTLLQALEHAPGSGATDNTEDPNIVLSLAYTVTDGDGDSAPGTISVTIDDDMPLPIAPDPLVGSNVAGTSATAALDSDDNVDNNVGADQLGTVQFPASLNPDSGLTSGGVPIIYTVSNDGLLLTGTAGGSTVFTITLNPDECRHKCLHPQYDRHRRY